MPKLLEGASVSVVLVRLKGAMASLKVALMVLLRHTADAPSAGLVKVTVGKVVSSASAVLKVQTLLAAKGLLAKSVAAVLTVAVKPVLLGSGDGLVGVNVAVREPTA